MALSDFIAAVVSWLRAGYPRGIPDADWVPLLALLSRRLTDEEVAKVAEALAAAGAVPADKVAIAVEITKTTDELPSAQDIDRVRARLDEVRRPTDPSDW